jgi:hypothetical protein
MSSHTDHRIGASGEIWPAFSTIMHDTATQISDRPPRLFLVVAELRRLSERRGAPRPAPTSGRGPGCSSRHVPESQKESHA